MVEVPFLPASVVDGLMKIGVDGWSITPSKAKCRNREPYKPLRRG